jgi:hypothetical protein
VLAAERRGILTSATKSNASRHGYALWDEIAQEVIGGMAMTEGVGAAIAERMSSARERSNVRSTLVHCDPWHETELRRLARARRACASATRSASNSSPRPART